MKKKMRLGLSMLAGLSLTAGCGDDDGTNPPASTSFSVTIQDVSTPGTLATDRAMGTVPLSPGAFAVFTGSNPMWTTGQVADAGTERIAEDGFPGPPLTSASMGSKTTMLEAAANVSDSDVFQSAGGPLGPAFEAGASGTFTFSASPGDRLALETMFVQSNDWFYGLDIALFDASGDPVSGDVTADVQLYDAGTEEDTAPGTGDFQKPAQADDATDFGPDENVPVQLAIVRHPDFAIPPNSAIIRVTIAPAP